MTSVIELTELRKLDGGILTKRISLGDDGQLKSDGSPCRLVVGRASRVILNGSNPAAALADRLNGMGSHIALTLGQMSAAVGSECYVASRKERAECAEWVGDDLPVITRTLDYFSWSAGPGWVYVDFDRKGMPASVQARLAELGGFEAALRFLIVGLDGVAIVVRGSSSDGIRNTETGERYEGSGGLHVYILLTVQGDMPRLLEALHQRAWLAGLGWFVVGTAGQLLERSIIDVAVGSPERLVFEGEPDVLPPLMQDQTKRRAVASKATAPLDSRAAVPDLTPAERREYDRLVKAERARLKPEAERQERRWVKRESAKLGPDGPAILQAALKHQILSGGMLLQFDTLGEVTVDAVMAEPERYDGATLADPIDGAERGKSKLFVNGDGSVIVHSFAHGERNFRLRYSVAGIRAALEQAGKDARKIYIRLLLGAELDQADEEQIIGLVSQLTGSGRRALKADLKAARAEAARERVAEYTAADGRVTRLAPDKDGERSPIVAALEAILRQESPPTVFKSVAGDVVRVVSKPSALLHLLDSDTAAGGVHADMFAPAPASPLISPHTVESMREVIEQRICYVQHTRDAVREVTLADPFIRHLLAPRQDSTLPRLTAISDVPVVTPRGELIVAGGYHPNSGIYFTCSEAEAQAVEPHDCSDAAVRDAYLSLANELFIDVAFRDRDQGIAASVAIMLTIMNQPVLPEKPACNMTAPLRGSGKTTLVNMIVRTITRRSAAAAAWSTNPEERRKTLFAVAREGHQAAVYDNIMRGTTIRDANIERMSTAAEVSDRVLGESRTETVRSPVVIFTGNALVMGGDLGSRTLTIELTASQTDPENREFKHPDILGWCDRNRTRLLKAALTILRGNPMLKDKAAVPQTRFKAWFVLIGSPVEHAAKLAEMPVRMKDLFALSESEDETTGVLADLVELLLEAFPNGQFTIEELMRWLDNPVKGVLLLEAVNSLSRQPLRLVTAKTVAAVLQRNVKGRPILAADSKVWTLAVTKRRSNSEKVVWKLESPDAGFSTRL